MTKTKLKMRTAREYADEIWGTETLSDISEFNIPLSMAVSMMENFANEKNSELLDRYNEAIEVLGLITNAEPLDRWMLIEKAEQTISKAKDLTPSPSIEEQNI